MVSNGYENALLIITKTIDEVMTGEIQLQDQVVSKFLGQDLEKLVSACICCYSTYRGWKIVDTR